MSIVLVGSTSGSCTLQEQAVAGNTVLTLPTTSGTVLTTGSSGQSIPKAALPTGSVLQVVQGTTNTKTTVAANTYTDTTLSASITPTSSSSKILALIYQQCVVNSYAGPNGLGIRLLRGSTNIFDPSPFDAQGPFLVYGYAGNAIWTMVSFSYLDSPATTSSITYKIQGRPYDAAISGCIFQGGTTTATSVITLLEIAA